VRLPGMANAVLVEPETLNAKSHIAILITHPERANNFNYGTGRNFQALLWLYDNWLSKPGRL
jgi:hypothetical protein